MVVLFRATRAAYKLSCYSRSVTSNTEMDWSDQLSQIQRWTGRINYLKYRGGLVGSIISNTEMDWSDQLSQVQRWTDWLDQLSQIQRWTDWLDQLSQIHIWNGRIKYLKYRDGLVGSIISNT
jgi:hypothetical protein